MLRYFLLLLPISLLLLLSPLVNGAIGVGRSEENEDPLIRQVTSRDQSQNDLTLDADYHHFAKFIEKFKKSYRSVEEHAHRFGVFKANLRRARRHQVLDPGAEHGVTPFSDLTPKEFERYLGLRKGAGLKEAKAAPILPTDGLPEEFDWREKGAVTAVKNQEQWCIINRSSNKRLQIAKLLHPVSTPGRFEVSPTVGGAELESYYEVFNIEILEAALNTRRDKLKKLFGHQRQRATVKATEKQTRFLSKHSSSSHSIVWPFGTESSSTYMFNMEIWKVIHAKKHH